MRPGRPARVRGGILLFLLLPAAPARGDTSGIWYNRSLRTTGMTEVILDGRIASPSVETREDWNVVTRLDLEVAPLEDDDWEVAFSGSLTGDIDGRRPGTEPGIYNGIQETYRSNVQPQVTRAHATWNLRRDFGVVSAPRLRVGRQYQLGGDALWFDGADFRSEIPVGSRRLEIGAFGGVPVRLHESASNDWIAGGQIGTRLGRAGLDLIVYHLEEDARFGGTRRENVARASVRSPVGKNAGFFGTVRGIGGGEMDARSLLHWNPRGGRVRLRAEGRVQVEDRGAHATEVDLASLVLGRSVGAPRRAYRELGLGASAPLGDRFALDLGGTTRSSNGPADAGNVDFDRLYATLSASDLRLGGWPMEGNVTLEAYESVADWTRTASGEVAVRPRPNLRLSAGTSYALFSYDYVTQRVRDDVRIGTARVEWRPVERLKIETRYDIEDDDERTHHFVRMRVRREF